MSKRIPARFARKPSARLGRPAKRRCKAPSFILSTAAALLLPQLVKAQLYWDPDGNSANATFGGSGIWDTTSLFWDDNFDGVNRAWVNNPPGDARFEGVGGQIRLGAPITARILDFAVPGYELTNNGVPTNTLTLSGLSTGFALQSGRLEVNVQILGTDGLLLAHTTPNLDGLSGTLVLTNPNNLYEGMTTLAGGVLEIDNLPNLGQASSIGVGGPEFVFDPLIGFGRNFNPYITFDGGMLRYTGNGTGTNRTFNISVGGGGIESSGTGGGLGFSVFSGGVQVINSGSRTFTLSGTNKAYNNLSSALTDPTVGVLSVVKAGSGTWVANAGNLYSGSTSITGGTLIVTNMGSSGGGSGLGASEPIARNLVIDGGTMRFTGAPVVANTPITTDRSFTLGPNGARIEGSGSSGLQFVNTGAIAASGSGDRTLTLGGNWVGTSLALDNVVRVQITDPTHGWVLTGANTMARFTPNSPETFEQTVTISNLQSGESLHSIDFDPATGKLYAMGTTGSGATNRLYEINIPAANATTTTAQSVVTVAGLNVGAAANFGFDFDPVTGRVRLTTNTDKNYSFAKNGTGLTEHSDINPAGSTIIALGYSNNFAGASSTTLYGIDTVADTLVIIDPATGAVTSVGTLDSTTRDYAVLDVSGLDITSNGAAFAMLQDTATATFRLVGINLLTGDASILGSGANPTFASTTARDLAMTVTGKTSLLKTGPGNWTLDRQGKHIGHTYTGSTTIEQGRLTLNFSPADTPDQHLISPQSALILAGGTLAITGKNAIENEQTFSGLTLLPGGSAITPTAGTGGKVTVNLGPLATRPAFATLALQGSGDTAFTMTAANDSTGILGAWATLDGIDWPMMSGTNVVPYNGYTNVALGGAIANGSNHVKLTTGTGNVTLGAATTTINTLNQGATTAATISNPGQTLRLGAMGGILMGNQALTIGTAANSGTLTAGGAANTAGELILHNNSTALLTINSVIANNGTGQVSVVNAGSGITVLNGANTYTGNTVLNGGWLFLGDNRALSTSTLVINSSGVPALIASSSSGGREFRNDIILNSDVQFVDNRTTGATGTGGLVVRGNINLTGGERIITVNAHGAVATPIPGYVTLDGTITNGTLVKAGGGALAFNDLTLTNVESIILTQGSLDIWSPAGLGNTPINVPPGSTGVLSASGGVFTPIQSNILLGGNLTLGRNQLSEGIDLGGVIDLSNSTVAIPRIISAAGQFPQQQHRLSGTVVNGALGKAGSSELVVTGGANSYEGGTVIFSTTTGSTLRVTATGRLGANVLDNNIFVVADATSQGSINVPANSFATLRLESISSLGDKQAIVLNNLATTATPVLAWGSAFEENPGEIGFVNFFNGTVFNTGLKNIRVYGGGTDRPVTMAIDGIRSGVDTVGKVFEGVPDVGVWLGATAANGVYTAPTLAVSFDATYRLGGGGGTLTIANANVLTGAFNNVVTGSYDQIARGLTGTVFLPKAQDFGGILTVGAGTTLVVGLNGALGTNPGPIYLRGGILNLRTTGTHHSTDSQYAGRNFAFFSTSTMNIDPLGGGQNGRVEIGGLDFSEVANSATEAVLPAAPTFVSNNSNNFELRVKGPVTLISNLPATPSASVTNTFQVNSGFLTIESTIAQTEPLVSAGANFQKSGGGTLILTQPMEHTGLTIANGGTFVLTRPDIVPGTMRLQSGTLSLRSNSPTPVEYDFSTFQLFGSTVGTIFVGPMSSTGIATYSGTRMDLPNIASTVNGTAWPTAVTINGTLNSSLRVLGTTSIGANFTMTVNTARTELVGNIIGATGGAFNFTKAGNGTLILSGRNNLTGNTVISQGTLVANHDTAGTIADTFGSGSLSIAGTASAALLIAGGRTINNPIALNSTGGTQLLGGYDANGNKTFSGAITLTGTAGNTGVTFTSESGSTVSITGVISGGSGGAVNVGSLSGGVLLPIAGTPALGRGTVFFDPATGTGNTFALPLVVNNGTLIGRAQTSGSPFGNGNPITIHNGVLQLNGRGTTTNTSHGALTVAAAARLVMSDPADDGATTQFSVASLTRAGNGTLTLAPINATGEERVSVASAPGVVNGILPPWMVQAGSGGGDFLTVNSGDLIPATYTNGTLDSAVSTSVRNATSGSPLTADRSVFAFKTGTSIDLGGKTLRVGDVTDTGAALASAAGGIILNNGAGIHSGTLDFGHAEGVIYVDEGATSTIDASITGLAGLSGVALTDVRTATVPNNQRVVTSGSNVLIGLPSTARLQPGAIVTGSGIPANAYIVAVLSPTSVQLSAAATASSGTGASVPLTFNSASSVTKVGNGTLILSRANSYRGNTVIQEGILRMGTTNAIGRYTNNGLVVPSNVSIGSRGKLDLNGFDTEIGALAGTFGSVVDAGNSRLTVGRAASTANVTTVFSGQLLGGPGAVLQKIGPGTLLLDNTRADADANTFSGSVFVDQGTLIVVVADQTNGTPFAVGNSLASVETFTLRGGTLSLRTSGDNVSASNQNMMGKYNIMSMGANSILDVTRLGTTETQKTIELGTLTLGVQEFQTTMSTSAAIVPAFMGTVTLTNHARINTNSAELSISGAITDNGQGFTLNKFGGSNLFLFNSDNNYSGGTIVAGGNLFFGARGPDVLRFSGNSFVPNDSGRAGTGPIVLETNTVINFTDIENLAPGQTVRVLSGSTQYGSSSGFVIQTDRKVSQFNLRTLGRGSLQIGVQSGTYTTPIDMSKFGNGEWGLSSGRSVETLYTAPTLGAGAGNVFRFYGSSGSAFVIMEKNAITGTGAVELGRALTDLGTNPGQSNASIRFMMPQDYTGRTLIHRNANAAGPANALLDIRGTVASGTSASNPIEVYGRLLATGAGTFTNSETAQTNFNSHVLLRPGSELALDYNANTSNATTFLVPLGTTSSTGFLNKWGDSQPIVLDGASLRVTSAASALTTEIIGAVTHKGAAEIFPQSAGTGGNSVVLINGALSRVDLSTLAFRSEAARLGVSGEPGTISGQRIAFKNYADAVASGVVRGVVNGGSANGTVINMVPARYYSNGSNTFVDYDPDTILGFSDVPFTSVSNSTFNLGNPNNGTAIVDHITTDVTSVPAGIDIWALRTNVEIGSSSTTNPITIRSGGLAVTDAGTIFTPLVFRNGPTAQAIHNVEADVWTVSGTVTLRGRVTATNLVKTGGGTLVLAANNSTAGEEGLRGAIQINGGTLVLGGTDASGAAINAAEALGGVTDLRLHAGNFNNAGNQMPQVNLLSNTAATYNQKITVSQFVPFATLNVDRVSGTGTNQGLNVAGGLTIEGGGSDGTVLAFTNGNDFDFTSSGVTTLGVPMGGDPATAPITISVTNNSGTNNVMFSGRVTGPAPMVKAGNGPLILGNNSTATPNDFSGGLTINDGTLQLRNGATGTGSVAAFQAAGTGSILLNRGTLQLFSNVTSNLANLNTNHLTIAGHGILLFDRAGTVNTPVLSLGGDTAILTTQNSTNIQINSTGSTGGGVWAGKTVINDSPTFNVAQTSFTLGNGTGGDSITGTGHIYKTGANVLLFNSGGNTNTLSGGIDIFQGQVRIASNTAETFGTGAIRLSPSGILGVNNVANLPGGNTQVANFHSNSTAFAGLALRANGLAPSSFLNASNITTGQAGNGVGNGGLLAIDATYSAALPAQSALFDGAWFYGSTSGGTYSGAALGAGVNSTYRLGGGGSTLNLATTANMLSGANSVLVGRPNGLAGNGTVSFQVSNSFTGGTTISRVRDTAGNFTVSVADILRGFSDSPLGSGSVEVFGNLQFFSSGTGVLQGSAVTGAGGANRNTFAFHPGARLIFTNTTVYNTTANIEGRWADSAGISLRSSSLEMVGNTTAGTHGNDFYNSETVGAVTFTGGSELRVARGGTSVDAQLIMPSLERVGTGTATLVHTSGALGARPYNSGAAQGTGLLGTGVDAITIVDRDDLVDTNGVVKPFIVSRSEHNFLFYDAINDSLRVLTQTLANDNGILYTTNTATSVALNEPLAILDNNAAATLNGITDVYALRLQQDLSPSADGQFNTVTIRSGGLTLGTAARNIHTNLIFGTAAAPAEALIHASSANLTINGQITASAITKFGISSITINQDQPRVTASVPWNVNQGQLIVQTPGGLGLGPVNLNGWTGNTGQTTTELRLVFNPGTPEELVFSSGKITALDFNLIRAQTANDRTVRIADIDLKTTNAVPGTGVPGVLWLRVDGSRSQMRTGALTMFDDYVIQVDATSFGPGSTSGVQPDSIKNAGTHNLTKIGDGVLVLGDNSSTFTGMGKTMTVNEGAVKVLHNGSLGAAGTVAIIDNGGALEIAKPNFVPAGTLVQRSGSIERWSVDNARDGAEVDIGDTNNRGVHLQVAANQTGTKTINLWGGSIMGFLPMDYDEIAVFHSLGSNVSVKLKTDSMLGQPYPAGTNVVGGGVNHVYYDMGKQNQLNNPMNPLLQGSVLDIRGTISGELGSETLTKVGMDVVQLSGNNNAGLGFNTTIREGMIILGSANALPASKALAVNSNGTLDLNGFNASTGSLSGNSGNAVIGNSATTTNTLTVKGSGSYAGGLTGNLEFKYSGGSTFTLSGSHAHSGATTVENGGTLILTGSASGSLTYKADAGATLNVTNANGVANSFQVVTGQTLAGGSESGIGIVAGAVAVRNGATLSPGMELGLAGRLQINGNLSLESGSTFELELAGNAVGQYDQLIVTGSTMNLGGATLDGTVAFGSVLPGQVYYIAIHDNAGATTGTFAGLAQNDLFWMSGYEFQISYTANSVQGDAGFNSLTGNDVALLVTIPEPGSVASLCAGLGTLIGLGRFRRRHR